MKTWFITGCSTGIGRGIAEAVLKKGDQAVITARNKEKLDDLVTQYPKTALAVSLELTSRESISNAVEEAKKHFGPIDVLINNAGHGYRAAVEEGLDEDVYNLFETNLFGPIELIKQLLPQMRKNRYGAIVNVSSIAAVRSGVGSGYYAASKAALESISDALYQEVHPLGIKVMVVEPGSFRTAFYDEALQTTETKIDDYAETAGKNRTENTVNNQDQPGDPMKAGQIIVETIEQEEYPRTLLLGNDAVEVVTTTLTNQLHEIEQYKKSV